MNHLDNQVRWLSEKGTDTDVVLSTRVRLARNLKNMPYSIRLSETGKKKVLDAVVGAVTDTTEPLFRTLSYEAMERLEEEQKALLLEKYLISRELMGESFGGVLVNDAETLSIMINEEDHLRIQTLRAGLGIQEAYEEADHVDDLLYARLPIAFHERFGYLTTCPTNVGSGMRASVMLHLPGHVGAHRIGPLVERILKLGFVVRGVYGENSDASGNLFQISNQVTLGDSEENVLKKLSALIREIIDEERNLQKAIYNADPLMMEDRCRRALGILRECRLLPEKEAARLLSLVWQGANLGLIPEVTTDQLARLMFEMRPEMLDEHKKDKKEDAVLRANRMREAFGTK